MDDSIELAKLKSEADRSNEERRLLLAGSEFLKAHGFRIEGTYSGPDTYLQGRFEARQQTGAYSGSRR